MSKSIISLKNSSIEEVTKGMLFHSGDVFATSIQIAKYFGIRHDDLLRKIKSFNSFDKLISFRKITERTRSIKGREYPYYELDADAYSFVCLSITGKKAEAFKWIFIEAFKQATIGVVSSKATISANKANQDWIEARTESKDTRKILTDKIKEFCLYAQNQRAKPYDKVCPFYISITKAIYDFHELAQPKAADTLRDLYSGDVVEVIEDSEMKVVTLLDNIICNGKDYHNIKKQIFNHLKK